DGRAPRARSGRGPGAAARSRPAGEQPRRARRLGGRQRPESAQHRQADDTARNVFKKVKPKTLQIFSRQFATMIEAGLNVVAALVILEQQTDDPYFGQVIKELRADVESGLLLSEAMKRHPKIFDRLFISMVE